MSRVTFRPAWSISGSLLLCQPAPPPGLDPVDEQQTLPFMESSRIIYAAGFHEVGREVVAEETSAS